MKLTKKKITNIGFKKIYSKGIKHLNINPFGMIPDRLNRILDDNLQSDERHEIASAYEQEFEYKCSTWGSSICYTYIVVMNRKKYLCAEGLEDYWVEEINKIEDILNNVSIKYFLENKTNP